MPPPSTLALAVLLVSAMASAVNPTVTLNKGTFIGTTNGSVNSFLGIPYGQSTAPPNRFQRPKLVAPYSGTFNATAFGPACPQLESLQGVAPFAQLPLQTLIIINEALVPLTVPTSEDCLSVNVFAPTVARQGSNLPVVAWIHGGGFETGGSSQYPADKIIARSIALNQPIIFVSLNYRMGAWGFLASKEVKAAGVGNLGLRDQRLAFEWIQKYISNFGGDPSKVTIWGESAGAVSVSYHLLINNGDPAGLFRGAVMESGAPTFVGDITKKQGDYDSLVKVLGCSGSKDTLACLRTVPADALQAAVNNTDSIFAFRSLNLVWQPTVDGDIVPETPPTLIQKGLVADVPFISGNNDDEGTLFSLVQPNITNDADFRSYVKFIFLPNASPSDLAAVAKAYPDDVTQGSPFDTGRNNVLTPEFKRLAAYQGDTAFQVPRRFLMSHRTGKQRMFAFLNKRLKALPDLGSTHGIDLIQFFQQGELQDYLIYFVNALDPNAGVEAGSNLINWPEWTNNSPNMLELLDTGLNPTGGGTLSLLQDTYRADAMALLTRLQLVNLI